MAEIKEIGKKLKFQRKKLGLTQIELGIKNGVSYTSISDYEKEKAFRRKKSLEKLANTLGVDVCEFSMPEPAKEAPKIESVKGELRLFKAIFKDLIMDTSVEIPLYGTTPAGSPEEA